MVGRRSVDTDVDENGQPIKANEPKVSRKTGKRRVGKPRAITKAKIERICNTIRAGNYVKTSVIANGVNYNTFMDYYNYCLISYKDRNSATGYSDLAELDADYKAAQYEALFPIK